MLEVITSHVHNKVFSQEDIPSCADNAILPTYNIEVSE